MSDLLSIKIKIGDREYPMRVALGDEEVIRRSGKMVNDRIKYYKERFGISEMQDLLAMVAFDSYIAKTKQERSTGESFEILGEKVNALNSLVKESLDS